MPRKSLFSSYFLRGCSHLIPLPTTISILPEYLAKLVNQSSDTLTVSLQASSWYHSFLEPHPLLRTSSLAVLAIFHLAIKMHLTKALLLLFAATPTTIAKPATRETVPSTSLSNHRRYLLPFDTVVTWGPTVLPTSVTTTCSHSSATTAAKLSDDFTRSRRPQNGRLGLPEIELPGQPVSTPTPTPNIVERQVFPRQSYYPGWSLGRRWLIFGLPSTITSLIILSILIRCSCLARRRRRLANSPPYTGHDVPLGEISRNPSTQKRPHVGDESPEVAGG